MQIGGAEPDTADDDLQRWVGAMPGDTALPDRADQGEVRRNNLELVLRHVLARRDSRAGIAGRTGLTRATVSRLVSELIASGLLREDGHHITGNNGRPGTALALNGRHVFGVGAEINVDHLAVLVADLSGATVYERRDAFDPRAAGPATTIRALAQLCETAVKESIARLPTSGVAAVRHPPVVVGIAVGVAGIVDVGGGAVTYAPNLDWRDVPISAPLAAELDLAPGTVVRIGNEANFAAVAEVRFGAYAGASDIVYLEGEVGVGGGIICGGRPLLGRRGQGGEVGHTTLDVDGPVCGCGRRGCWEAYVGLTAVMRAAGLDEEAGKGRPNGIDEKVAQLIEKAEFGDERTLCALGRAGTWVGVGAANLANVLNPQAVILGGYFAPLARWLMPSARESFAQRAFGPLDQVGDLAVSRLGLSAATRGAASVMIDLIVSDPTQLSAPVSNG